MKFIYAFGVLVSSYFLYKHKQKAQKLLLVHSNNRLSRLFYLINHKLFESFKPTLFLFSGHAQTIFLELITIVLRFFRNIFKFFNFKYEREIFTLKDGCKLAVDRATRRISIKLNKEEIEKILLVFPGVTSTSDDYYVQALLDDFCEEYDCRVLNARGLGGVKLNSPEMISSACYSDVAEYIEKVCYDNPTKKIFGLGFSFGGMMLARYLGSHGENVPNNFIAACGICYPCCLEKVKNYVELNLNGLYSRVSLNNIKTTFFNNLQVVFDDTYHLSKSTKILENKEMIIEQVRACTLVSQFDNVWTTKILGLKSLQEYYDYSRLEKYLANIKVPFLSLFAEDDPIIPIDSIPFKTLQANPNTVTVVTQYGGHLAFFGGLLIPQRIIDQPIKTFMATVEILKDTQNYII